MFNILSDLIQFDIPTPFCTNLLKYNRYANYEVPAFSGISIEDFKFLSSNSNRPMKSTKLLYNFLTGLLTIKMPDFAHKTIIGLFKAIVDKQLFIMGVPESTDDLTAVLEVSILKSALRLAIYVRGLLEMPRTTVKVCIMINLSQANNLIIDIYGWKTNQNLHAVFTEEIWLEFVMFVGNLLVTFVNRF
ncbi:hypothetical protein BDW68DRAFT_193001 [Aspergillus falconensis]